MVKSTVVTALLLLCAHVPSGWGQATTDVSVGVRPDRVRVGESFVVTVRTAHAAWPDQVDVEVSSGASVLDYEDRSSSGVGGAQARLVFERSFRMEAHAQGGLALTALVVFGRDTIRREVPPVAVYPAGLAWPTDTRPRGNRDPETGSPLPEGTPRSTVGVDADRQRAPEGLYPPAYRYPGVTAPGATPYRYPTPYGYPDATGPATPTPSPYPSPYPSPGGTQYGAPYGNPYASPYGPSGWGVAPYGSGWAPGAAGDPWWPELVPRLERYQTAADDPNGLVRLEAGLTPDPVYAGQQVTFLATATFPPEAMARLGGAPEFFPPTAADAWTVDLPYAPPSAAAVRGRAQEAHTFMRAFFPLSPGRFVVDPARLLYSVGGGAPGRPLLDTLATEGLVTEVLPVPERDAPPGWNGAVGRYRVEAWLEPEAVAWGEAAFLTVAISGAGHVRSLTRPDPGQVWGAELRPTGERALPEVRDGVVGGVKTFSWLVVPVEPGPLRIGPVIFSYFDPWTGAFAQVASEELILHAGDVGVVQPQGRRGGGGSGLVPGRTEPPASAQASPVRAPDGPREMRSSVLARDDSLAVLAARVAAVPGDGDAWFELARLRGEARPGDGRVAWASLSGLRNAPRHGGLRSATLRGGGPKGVPGLAALPLTLWESLVLGALLGMAGSLVAVSTLRRAWLREAGLPGPGPWIGQGLLALLLMAGATVCLEPAVALQADAGVVVGGGAALRVRPAMSAEVRSELAAGTSLNVRDSFGGWVRVTTPEGTEGWVEGARVEALPPVSLF